MIDRKYPIDSRGCDPILTRDKSDGQDFCGTAQIAACGAASG
ncbi:hypothetical protein CPter91_0283 [Collimonas pratensis]|uniref:Uncharacterized protein n=1 Tax=Collimonas pratensis TaxID=279113 RepID=A0A127PZ79_9BURK|nr:hypothetical protein CPter91_0283 [Collimonas pratensis]